MILHLLFATLPLIIFLYISHKKRKRTKPLQPPGPPGLPLIGNLHQISKSGKPHVYLWKLSKKYGSIMQMKFGPVPVLVISSAKSAKEVLKTQDLAFCSRPKRLGQVKLTYNSSDMLFQPYNDYWREVKKITAVHLFSLKKVQSFRPVREDEVSRLVSKISGSGIEGVNLSEMVICMTSSLICRVAFGKRYDERGDEMRWFDKQILHEAPALLAAIYVSDYFPLFGWVDKLSGLMDRLDRAFGNLDSFYQSLIDEHLNPDRRRMEEEDDILDVLIRIKEENSCSFELNWDHIKALLMDIFLGATNTSATAIIWTMTALIKAPIVMKKAQSEIRELVGKKSKPNEDDLQKLPYLKAVVNEALRLYPPAPLLVPRETMESCMLEGYEIRPKTVVYVNAWAIARDTEYWENPDEFLPERFLNSNIDVKGQDFGVIPFGSGRRICPGMSMGLANVELAVANLLYFFDWELPHGMKPDDIDTDVLPGFSMQKKNPLYLVPKKYIL